MTGRLESTHMGQLARELSARPCGTHSIELAQAAGSTVTLAASLLSAWFDRKHLVRSSSNSRGLGALVMQYFASPTHRDAWQALPVQARPNVMRKRHSVTKSPPKARIRKPRPVKAKPIGKVQAPSWETLGAKTSRNATTVGIASGYDSRTQMGPIEAAAFVGEFGRMGVGRYIA